ncbi:hypothetical protein NAPIS_ORF02427 [Vairimorpha apis BRL 01]|uniref:Uncharacterized protein n=2 Tax=Vairimorpha apis BRL 01 TaxID=1037528 RepID=T0M9F6_9MICR|nr:hypothetical protein NAPIS_ORF02427 [Vairimorpha apis BRL 01]
MIQTCLEELLKDFESFSTSDIDICLSKGRICDIECMLSSVCGRKIKTDGVVILLNFFVDVYRVIECNEGESCNRVCCKGDCDTEEKCMCSGNRMCNKMDCMCGTKGNIVCCSTKGNRLCKDKRVCNDNIISNTNCNISNNNCNSSQMVKDKLCEKDSCSNNKLITEDQKNNESSKIYESSKNLGFYGNIKSKDLNNNQNNGENITINRDINSDITSNRDKSTTDRNINKDNITINRDTNNSDCMINRDTNKDTYKETNNKYTTPNKNTTFNRDTTTIKNTYKNTTTYNSTPNNSIKYKDNININKKFNTDTKK